MDTDTFSIWLDGTQAVADQPLKRTGGDFHKVILQSGFNCDPENRFSLDQIRVLDWMPPVAAAKSSWGRIRALYR